VILISARVHPGETPSSYALEGLVRALTNKSDLRSQLLLRFFNFKIVPMLNPDGVEHGHYRMDIYGQNLNRYYNNCTPTKQ
jgi:murein tripeptide amidase MpaA